MLSRANRERSSVDILVAIFFCKACKASRYLMVERLVYVSTNKTLMAEERGEREGGGLREG